MLLIAVLALVLASCASSDSDSASSDGSGGGGGKAATCAGKTGETATAEPLGAKDDGDGAGKKVGMVFDIGGKDDKSFNESAFDGITAAADNMGITAKELEPNADGTNREALLRQLADDGNQLIIGVGFNFAESIPLVAKDYPDVKFAIIDSVVDADNVASLVFAEEQGSFLVGAAAAQSSGTGTVGFVGGVETDLIKKFQAGYEAGVAEVAKDDKVEVKYITPDGDFSGFNDPAKGKTIAKGLYDAGADVVYHAAGGSGSGVFEAAAEADHLAIGVDSNQYLQVKAAQQKCILTSMLKRVDVAVYSTIKDFVNGDFKAGTSTFDLKNGGIDFATQGGQIKDEKQLEQLKKDIIDGKIKVPTAP
ncbi:BMP family ABC transporter substrate-binding protein [Aquihabitans sp. G128]|uniref:BMP family lipoprotein n=1 Tax=Aquihabitans sp. G128 TaxID=2849779 RepID=UPI001C2109C4|nr:BMP family ABC transporter substrate-binding protein [Aquihabitans sp. G128]QXC63235.1 BMP family ABC transporter substrate-binding protein [Aquihabitans sp. G128]